MEQESLNKMDMGQKFLQKDISKSPQKGLDVGTFINVNPWYVQDALNNPKYLDIKDSINFGLAAKFANEYNQLSAQFQSNPQGIGKVSADATFNISNNTNLKAFYEKAFGNPYNNVNKYGLSLEQKF